MSLPSRNFIRIDIFNTDSWKFESAKEFPLVAWCSVKIHESLLIGSNATAGDRRTHEQRDYNVQLNQYVLLKQEWSAAIRTGLHTVSVCVLWTSAFGMLLPVPSRFDEDVNNIKNDFKYEVYRAPFK
jgi:hypothetical protein